MKSNLYLVNIVPTIVLGYLIFTLLVVDVGDACGPGRSSARRMRRRRYPPLVQRQYLPNVSENTLGASGRPEGPIRRHDKRFKELVQNWNPDIEFRDDERTGADRMMTQRLKEKLSVLAISVMNQWPNVKLRVIEGWDEDNRHSVNSLHYEGRAVDITTNDRDKSKYGMLARLAVESGFDWVHYESRSHVHCSVKSEKADTIRSNGCFDGKSLVETPKGQMEMSQLQTNDLVLTMNSQSGQFQFSPVMLWLDKDENGQELFVELETSSGKLIRLTSSHLIYVADEPFDLTKQQQQQQQQQHQLQQTTSPDDQTTLADATKVIQLVQPGSGDNNQNNYYYFYETETQQRQHQNSPADIQIAPGVSNENDNPNKTNTMPLMATNYVPKQRTTATATTTLNVDDFAYTIYARNAFVGQYLLINSNDGQAIDQQIKLSAPPKSNDDHYGANSKDRTPNRLAFNKVDKNKNNNHQNVQSSSIYSAASDDQSLAQPKIKLDQIVSVNYVLSNGIFAPLTREGNIVVDSVVASCYAVISDHEMAHMSFAPVRWLSYLQEWLFGLKPMSPVENRLLRTMNTTTTTNHDHDDDDRRQIRSDDKILSDEYKLQDTQINTSASYYKRDHRSHRVAAIYGEDRQAHQNSGRNIHWYPFMLFNLARYILPNRYLY